MQRPTSVLVHPSQFPDRVSQDLIESLRTGRLNPKFHYLTHRQMQAWAALHLRYSPFFNAADGAGIYGAAFAWLACELPPRQVHVISLGCGTGGKDVRLLEQLVARGSEVEYTPVDVSLDMVLAAAQAASAPLRSQVCHPVVLDLAVADDLDSVIARPELDPAPRVILFLGMLPSFEPGLAGARLGSLARARDYVVISANLVAGADYAAGVRRVLPQYDNEETRAWLTIALEDLGLDARAGKMVFGIEPSPDLSGLLRLGAHWTPHRACAIRIGADRIELPAGNPLQVFFSNRYNEDCVGQFLEGAGLELVGAWVSQNGEEGVYVCRPATRMV